MSDLYERLQASRGARRAVPLLMAALLIVGLAAPPLIGIPALLVLVGFVGWMAVVSPARTVGLARIRLLVLGILVALLVARAFTALG